MRYRLRTLMIVTTLASVTAAGFAVDEGVGILVYLACLLLFLTAHRTTAIFRQKHADSLVTGIYYPIDPVLGFMSAIAVALAAAIAFSGTCLVAQTPIVVIYCRPGDADQAVARFRLGLYFFSLPIGTLAAIVVYRAFWPRSNASQQSSAAT